MDIVTEVYTGRYHIRDKSYKTDGIDTLVKIMFPINPLVRCMTVATTNPTSGHYESSGCSVTLAIIQQD